MSLLITQRIALQVLVEFNLTALETADLVAHRKALDPHTVIRCTHNSLVVFGDTAHRAHQVTKSLCGGERIGHHLCHGVE